VQKALKISGFVDNDQDWRSDFMTRSPVMEEKLAQAHMVAGTDARVLITGESGTGKELLARAIHKASPRRNRPFVSINCSAMAENMLESELFGHAAGAFAGATDDHRGLFQTAEGGTLLLDEIGDMPMRLQVKLLRALQENLIRPVGSTQAIPANVRVISSTHSDLQQQMAGGQFREDLYYRLNVVAIDIPPLRDHKEDIPALANFFLEKFVRDSGKSIRSITPQALKLLMDFHWPGNVRELENIIQRGVALSAGGALDVADIHLDSGARRSAPASGDGAHGASHHVLPEGMTLEQWEDETIREALRNANGNKSQAARALGLSRNALRYRLSKIGVADPPDTDS
jgi:transcriptional regulator with PAS, ATPase and Fis domain